MTRTSGCTRSSFKFYRNFIDRRDNFSPFHLFLSLSLFFTALRANLSFSSILWAWRDCFSPPPSLFVEEKKNETPLYKGNDGWPIGVFLDIITLVRHEPTSGTRFEGLSTRLSLNYSRNYSFSNKSFILSERKKLCFPPSLSLFVAIVAALNCQELGAAITRCKLKKLLATRYRSCMPK